MTDQPEPPVLTEEPSVPPPTQEEAKEDVEPPPLPQQPEQQFQHIFVVRHGHRSDDDPTWAEEILRPWDPELTKQGHDCAFKTGQDIKILCESLNITINQIISSPFLRCLQTASNLAKGIEYSGLIHLDHGVGELMNPHVMKIDKLTEIQQTRLNETGLCIDQKQIQTLFPSQFSSDDSPVPLASLEAGESRTSNGSGYARFRSSIDRIGLNTCDQNIIICTHGDGVAAAISKVLPSAMVYAAEYCSFAHLVRESSSSKTSNNLDWQLKQVYIYIYIYYNNLSI